MNMETLYRLLRHCGVIALLLAVVASAQAPPNNGKYRLGRRAIPDPRPLAKSEWPQSMPENRKEPVSTADNEAQDRSMVVRRRSGFKKKCGYCSWEFRTHDGSCNNLRHIRWGASNRGHLLHWRKSDPTPSMQSNPSARAVSNLVSKQSYSKPNRRTVSEWTTYFGQFIDHTYVASPSQSKTAAGGQDIRLDILVPDNDSDMLNLNNGSNIMHFTRSARTKTRGGWSVLNAISSFLDLSSVYGETDGRAKALRVLKNGKLKVSQGDMLPFNTEGLENAPSSSSSFFVAGDFRANEHIGLTTVHIIWLREHNLLCESLKRDFPKWGDERLYQMARKINSMNFQRVVIEEFYPAITGRRLPKYRGYNSRIDPTLSLLFTTAAFRIGHTMVRDEVTRYGCGNSKLPSLTLREVFFTAPRVLKYATIEEFLRGMTKSQAEETDVKVVELLRNFLFTGIQGEETFDIIAQNIQRGRDHGLPSYNRIRRVFGRRPIRRYEHLTKDRAVVKALRQAYGKHGVDKIDVWVGLMAEPHISYASMGLTTYLIFRQEFMRIRSGDRFFYARKNVLSRQVRASVYRHGHVKMRDIILRNSNISPHELGKSVWFTAGKPVNRLRQRSTRISRSTRRSSTADRSTRRLRSTSGRRTISGRRTATGRTSARRRVAVAQKPKKESARDRARRILQARRATSRRKPRSSLSSHGPSVRFLEESEDGSSSRMESFIL